MSHSSAEASTTPISAIVSDLDYLAAEVMADWKVPGVALAVVQDGKVALTRAYGQRDVEAGLPVTPATQFVICSITNLSPRPPSRCCTMRGGSTGPSRCATTCPSFA